MTRQEDIARLIAAGHIKEWCPTCDAYTLHDDSELVHAPGCPELTDPCNECGGYHCYAGKEDDCPALAKHLAAVVAYRKEHQSPCE